MTAPIIQPDATPAPMQGQALNDFIQAWLVSLTGLDGTLVRPAPQTTPPVIPPDTTVWMAFNAQVDKSDTFPFNGQIGDEFQLQRAENIKVLCSFYDQGTDGQAGKFASLLRDNLAIPQNLEVLYEQNMGLIGVEPEVEVPSLLKERWLYRVDLPFYVTRQVVRNYDVPTILTAEGQINTDDGITVPFHVENNT